MLVLSTTVEDDNADDGINAPDGAAAVVFAVAFDVTTGVVVVTLPAPAPAPFAASTAVVGEAVSGRGRGRSRR